MSASMSATPPIESIARPLFLTICDLASQHELTVFTDSRSIDIQSESLMYHLEDLHYYLPDNGVCVISGAFERFKVKATVRFIKIVERSKTAFNYDAVCSQCNGAGQRGERFCVHETAVVAAMRAIGFGAPIRNDLVGRYAPPGWDLPPGIVQWLDDLAESEPESAKKTPSLPAAAELRFLVDINASSHVTLRSVFMTDQETVGKARLIDFSVQSSARERAIAARLTDEERGWLMQLRGCQPTNAKATVQLNNVLDQQLLKTLIERGRALYRGVPEDSVPPRLTFGNGRSISPRWEVTDALTCRLDPGLEMKPGERLLNLPWAWLFDPSTASVSPLDGMSSTQIHRLQHAPEIPRQQISLFNAAMQRHAGIPIPAPEEFPDPIEERIAPRALVVLSAPNKTPVMHQTGYAFNSWTNYGKVPIVGEVFFRYGKGRVSADNTQTQRIIVRKDEQLIAYPRDTASESTLLKSIQSAGLKKETLNTGIKRQIWVQPEALGREAISLVQTLSAKGIQVELSPSIGIHCIEDAGDQIYGGVEEGAGGRYFIDAGVIVEGRRISLTDLACAAMADPEFSLSPDPEHDADRRLLVPSGETTLVSLPHARVREVIGPFFDFLVAMQNGTQGVSKDRQGRLTISRAALIAQAFSTRTGPFILGWDGMQPVRDAVQRLRIEGIADVPVTPEGFNGELYDYQQVGVKWLNVLCELGLGGVLADDMGLGKSVQILAHILMRRTKRTEAPVLVIAPPVVVKAWEDKFHFTPGLRMLVLKGQQRKLLMDQISEADIVFTNYNLMRNDIEILAQQSFSLVVFDEAQNLKTLNTVSHMVAARLKAEQVVMVSGRPIENNLAELYSQFMLALPGLLGEPRDFTRNFRTPIEKRADADARIRLKERITPFLLRRPKDQVAASLPPKTVILRTVAMEAAQRRLYNSIMLLMNREVWATVEKKGLQSSGIEILAAIRQLQQVCCHPRLLKGGKGDGCTTSGKLDYLMEQIEELLDEGRRILVYSHFVEYLTIISETLNARGVQHLMFTGKNRDKDKTRDQFQSGAYPVMLVSLKAGGVGLDFTAADTVLLASPWWNPGAEDQAVDRAHRIGQTRPVFVYKYIAENSIETSILQMQGKKAALASSILDEDAGAVPPLFELDDLVDLFGTLDAPKVNADDAIDVEWSEVPTADKQEALPPPSAGAPLTDKDVVCSWIRDTAAVAEMPISKLNLQLGLGPGWLSNRANGAARMPPSMVVRMANHLNLVAPTHVVDAAKRIWGVEDPELAHELSLQFTP